MSGGGGRRKAQGVISIGRDLSVAEAIGKERSPGERRKCNDRRTADTGSQPAQRMKKTVEILGRSKKKGIEGEEDRREVK